MENYQFSLTFFTVFTQWGIGCIAAYTLYCRLYAPQEILLKQTQKFAIAIWAIFTIGSLSSLAHLGSPFQAYNALRGLGSSWLSREVIIFSALNGLVTAWAATYFIKSISNLRQALGVFISILGIVGFIVSGQIYYVIEHQPSWHSYGVHVAFLTTAMITGFSTITAYIRFSEQKVPRLFLYLLGFSVVVLLFVISDFTKITGIESVQHLTWFRVLTSVLVGGIACALANTQDGKYTKTLVIASILIVTGEIAGRMIFYSAVLSKTPW